MVVDTVTGATSYPLGSVSFDNGPATGSFGSGGSCALAQDGSSATTSKCSVSYTPTAYNGGTHTIKASYAASDSVHADSADATGFGLTVTKRTTTTSVSCSPASRPINAATSCTATVVDTDTGSTSYPLGSVSFDNGPATGSLDRKSGVEGEQVGPGARTSKYTVSYTPTAYNGGTHTIKESDAARDRVHADRAEAAS